MSPKILLLGKNGQVGWELQRALAPLGSLVAHDRSTCDLSDIEGLSAIIEQAKPDVIVNAAAYTSVDRAEADSSTAFKINTEAVGAAAKLAAKLQALLVHYSTDYVFDGAKDNAYIESDAINPLSVYGRSKVLGERAILESGCEHLIFRTSWVFAARGANFAKTMLRLASEREELRVVADQWGAPTSAELIADITSHAIREMLSHRAQGGLYHLAAGGDTSWHGYANYVFEQAQLLGAQLKTSTAISIPAAEYPLPAPRPSNSRLNTAKLQSTFGVVLPDWRYHVRRMLEELLGSQ